MKFGQLKEDSMRKIFLHAENHVENEAGKLFPHLLLLFKNTLYEIKASFFF